MLKTTNTQFQSIELWFTDQINRPLQIEDKGKYYTINWVGLVKLGYLTEQKYRKHVAGMTFCNLQRNLETNMAKC